MADTAKLNAAAARHAEDLVAIRKIREGDVRALERLIDRYLNQLMGFFRYLRAPESMVEDLVQETFERVIRKLDAYDEQKKFSVWLLTVGRNLYFDQCRRETRKREHQQQIVSEPVTSPEDEVVERHTASELLQTLTPQEKFLVDLRVFQGMPFAEIAELTGEVEATLRSRFFRIMGRLRITLEKKAPGVAGSC
ncbi:MAG: sigma-70 family RNA polymerase sigma factor [Candidatus Riflebacteria bacterium]|nr:sigma-70 family RNA polymerase sigma factor [Candidatus Riflebacteria bacterium]